MLQDVKKVIGNSGHLGNLGITVDLGDDAIILRGKVNSFYLKQIAQELTKRTMKEHNVGQKIMVVNMIEVDG